MCTCMAVVNNTRIVCMVTPCLVALGNEIKIRGASIRANWTVAVKNVC